MKISKRGWAEPKATVSIWVMPLATYLIQLPLGTIIPDRQWIWWVAISAMFLTWLILSFKIEKNKDERI